jgi:hypothetical protein
MNTQQRAIKDMAAALAHAEELLPNDVVVMNGAAVGRWLLEQPEPVQEWMKPHPKCDEACLFQCTKGFTQFPKCAATPPAQPADQPDYEFHYRQLLEKYEALQSASKPAAWIGLTQREWDDLWDEHHDEYGYQLSADGYERAIEQRLKEKNT